jgi:hypothetical protein
MTQPNSIRWFDPSMLNRPNLVSYIKETGQISLRIYVFFYEKRRTRFSRLIGKQPTVQQCHFSAFPCMLIHTGTGLTSISPQSHSRIGQARTNYLPPPIVSPMGAGELLEMFLIEAGRLDTTATPRRTEPRTLSGFRSARLAHLRQTTFLYLAHSANVLIC